MAPGAEHLSSSLGASMNFIVQMWKHASKLLLRIPARERSLLPKELQVPSRPTPVRRERRERSSSESDLDLDIEKAELQ